MSLSSFGRQIFDDLQAEFQTECRRYRHKQFEYIRLETCERVPISSEIKGTPSSGSYITQMTHCYTTLVELQPASRVSRPARTTTSGASFLLDSLMTLLSPTVQ